MRNNCPRRLLLWTFLTLLPRLACADIPVLIDGIPGNITESTHAGWIAARSTNWNVERGVAPQPVTVAMNDGPWTATLALNAATGKSIPRIIIDFTALMGSKWVVLSRLTLRDATIRQFASSQAVGAGFPVSQFQIAANGYEWEYWSYSDVGAVTASAKGSFKYP